MRESIAIGVIEWQDRFLVGLRAAHQSLPGYSEFPGGRIEPGETAEAAVRRECREETGLDVEIQSEYAPQSHRYEHAEVELQFFACRPLQPNQPPRPPFRWVARHELAELKFPPANQRLLETLLGNP